MVNTFLPYSDFRRSAESLDRLRLGKQRCEAMQILSTIRNPNAKGWRNHPVVNMWRGYESALMFYFNCVVNEWVKRGYKNNMPLCEVDEEKIEMPWWMDNKDFHMSHQASLVRKFPEFYSSMFDVSDEQMSKGYVWPKIVEGVRIIEYAPVMQPVKKPKRKRDDSVTGNREGSQEKRTKGESKGEESGFSVGGDKRIVPLVIPRKFRIKK
jgi:hypothetical protein